MSTPRDRSSSPPRHRIANLKGYLPHSEEHALSTRGQTLPVLIRSLSKRRPSSFRAHGSYSNLSVLGERRDSADGETPKQKDAPGLWNSGKTRRASEEETRDDEDGRPNWESERERKMSAMDVLMTPQMRSQRLIGNSNPRYKWERYFKTEEELKKMSKPVRQYYERNNNLIQQYIYIDRLLDSSLPHSLIQEYNQPGNIVDIPPTILENASAPISPSLSGNGTPSTCGGRSESNNTNVRVKRTPKNLYKLPDKQPDEDTPLLPANEDDPEMGATPEIPVWEPEDDTDSGDTVVTVAIYINLVANTILLILKVIVTVLTSSVSVLASLVDSVLDFLSTAIVWTTTRLVSTKDQYKYPVGRRRLEPIGVLVFSVIMITSFFQVALEGFNKLTGDDHTVVQLSIPAIAIMASTVVTKFLCWLWCRFIKNSSVQALAQDAMTDVVFNTFSIIFPLIGYYAKLWWMDPLGGILLSFYVMFNWSRTTTEHIRNLTGAAATADERNVLLYLTMRFAKTIKQIQGLQAYHAGDKLNIEVDIVLDEHTSLRDSHDLGESLQYVLESVPTVDRAFVHLDYTGYNLPSHMEQRD